MFLVILINNVLTVHKYSFSTVPSTVLGAEVVQLVRWMTLNQEVAGSNLATIIWEKSACAVGQSTLANVVLDNDHLLYLDYEHGTLKDMIAALKSEDIILLYTKTKLVDIYTGYGKTSAS